MNAYLLRHHSSAAEAIVHHHRSVRRHLYLFPERKRGQGSNHGRQKDMRHRGNVWKKIVLKLYVPSLINCFIIIYSLYCVLYTVTLRICIIYRLYSLL